MNTTRMFKSRIVLRTHSSTTGPLRIGFLLLLVSGFVQAAEPPNTGGDVNSRMSRHSNKVESPKTRWLAWAAETGVSPAGLPKKKNSERNRDG